MRRKRSEFATSSSQGHNWAYRKLDFDSDVALADKIDDGLINAINLNLQPFFAHGGKLIQHHGWNDLL
jgi:feruloyl esterase